MPISRTRDKVKTLAALRRWLKRQRPRRVVFTNGCFDILHLGHVRYLEAARRLGSALIIGVNSDSSVRKLKGPGRPLQPARDRAEILAALACVNAVTIFDAHTPERLIRIVKPDVLVKGGDWAKHRIVGAAIVESSGGRVVRIPVIPGRSTSRIVQRLRRS